MKARTNGRLGEKGAGEYSKDESMHNVAQRAERRRAER